MKIAVGLVVLAALCFAGYFVGFLPGGAPGRGMTADDMLLAAAVGLLILAGGRVLYVTLSRTR